MRSRRAVVALSGAALCGSAFAADFIGGSIFVAAICKDGIFVASDSRGNILDARNERQTPLAYFDGLQKVFIVGEFVIVNTGQGFLSGVPVEVLWNESLRRHPAVSIRDFLRSSFNYFETRLSPAGRTLLARHLVAAAGFLDGQATIAYYDGNGQFGQISEGLVQSSPTKFVNLRSALPHMTSDQVALEAEKAILQYSSSSPENSAKMGGEIHKVFVSKSGFRWISKMPSKQTWKDAGELIQAISSGSIKLTLVPPATWDQVQGLLAGGPAK